jgi:hypothetical protein
MGIWLLLLVTAHSVPSAFSSSVVRAAVNYFNLWVSSTDDPIGRVGGTILEGLSGGYGLFATHFVSTPPLVPDIDPSPTDSQLTESSLMLLVSAISRDDRRALFPLLYFHKVPRYLIVRRIRIEVIRMGFSCQDLFYVVQESVAAYEVDKAFGFDVIHDRLRDLCWFIQLLFDASDPSNEDDRVELTAQARQVWYRIVEDNYHGPLII